MVEEGLDNEINTPESFSETCILLVKDPKQHESTLSTAIQLIIPFLLAGVGTVAASLQLNEVQYWPVYQNIPEIFILVPALLGLKGNLEMTLASRLSTHANLGHLSNADQRSSLIVGNLALVLFQAIVVAFLASLAAVVFQWVISGKINTHHAVLLCASSIITAFAASLLLGSVMVGLVLFCRAFYINPDNVATPIAAGLGDLTTLVFLSWFATRFYETTNMYIEVITVLLGIMLVPLLARLAARNDHTRRALFAGLTPVINAMVISSLGGLILDFTITKYNGIADFQLIINGVGGNLVAVQASRISTALHRSGRPGSLPSHEQICISPFSAFCVKNLTIHAQTAQMLMFLVIPGHIVFSLLVKWLVPNQLSYSLIFLVVYLGVAVLQVFLLLYIAQILIPCLWKFSIDPDNSAIPYLTALADLSGTILLGVAFKFLALTGQSEL